MTAATYLNPPVHYSVPEFRAMLAALKVGSWRPAFPTLHNQCFRLK